MAEERDVPDLGTIVNDLTATQERIDALVSNNKSDPVALAQALASFIQNDLMVIVKDLAESTLIGMQELQDMVDPIEIPGSAAQEIADLLQALKAQNAANPDLVARCDEALDVLDVGDDGEDEEE